MDVLIIDDEQSIRKTTSLIIETEGHYTEGAADTMSAEARLNEENFDLILLDLHIGEENGLSYLKELLNVCISKKFMQSIIN